ncbi:glycosyltransferase family 2 protein [Piscinibacter terrae]|uniref:Glycosyltransferase n=1 Tax=Piscinibacter terrae TaxID=2496871 RepID=A0A3N7K611_9BURK|nr:glycosyltransferase [Albitalea terrae]RQP26345.1 glycosyltransferase [Albitalea terrae]
MKQLGVVVIGRNEGERLRRCLESMSGMGPVVVYVDSGSTDGSVEMARSRGVEVVALDMSVPFTAARARNAGFARLRQVSPDIEFVQFVDGDCEVIDGWLQDAMSFLQDRADVSCVCGRLRERFPERSVYNRLCDFEWDRAPGETEACGGIAMMRAAVFQEMGAFREDMVAGEEPELCQRMRAKGWKIWRLPSAMAWHDAAMLRFGQWWKRSKRTGFGNAQRLWLTGRDTDASIVKQSLRTWLWAVLLPLVSLAGVIRFGRLGLLLLLLYPLQVLRIAVAMDRGWRFNLERGFFLVLGKFPELVGQIQFWMGHKKRQGSTTFDYKS